MSALKRFSLILILILFTLSVIDDLSKSTLERDAEPTEVISDTGIAHIKIKSGDTVLSITESINNMNKLDIAKVISDFEQLNPGTSIDNLIPESFYYFPLYNE